MFPDYSQNQSSWESSEAIRPDGQGFQHGTEIGYQEIGSFRHLQVKDHSFYFACDHGWVVIEFYTLEILRVTMGLEETMERSSSFAVVANPEPVKVTVEEKPEEFLLMGGKLKVRVEKRPFRLHFYNEKGRLLLSDGKGGMGWKGKEGVIAYKKRDSSHHFYGFGEKTGFLDKREERMVQWNSDVYAPHNPETDALYLSIPFFLSLRGGLAYGLFFDNTYRTEFDLKSENEGYSFSAEGGNLDYYFFAGPTPKDVLYQYTFLTGRMPLPPRWALGYHQSRYSYKSQEEVERVADLFRQKEIPCDALYLDIHYMKNYCSFTFDRVTFPCPKKLVEDLLQKGFHVVPIVDPGIPTDPEFPLYLEGVKLQAFCRFVEGELFKGEVWPGISVFPDFTANKVRAWWGNLHDFYTKLGIEGIWMDMNEPAVFNETKTMDLKVIHENDGEPLTHRALHNVYGLLMAKATYEGMVRLQGNHRRPFLLTRAGYAGVQRYSAVWTGDNRSFWEHMAMSIPMCLNLGLSGLPFCGSDVGGFAHDANGELLTRWVQLGAFMPFFRNHSALESVRQEPWSFGPEIEEIICQFIQLRYSLLPYLYTLFREGSKTGLPMMRPLFLEYPEDENTYNLSDAFLLGENLLVAPILGPGLTYRGLYLPLGTWFNYWTDEPLVGGHPILAMAGLDRIPLYIKEGTILPWGEKKSSTMEKDSVLKFHIYTKKEGFSCYTYYEDDGESFSYQSGIYFELEIHCSFSTSCVILETKEKNTKYRPHWNRTQWFFHGLSPHMKIIFNGKEIQDAGKTIDEQGRVTFMDDGGFL